MGALEVGIFSVVQGFRMAKEQQFKVSGMKCGGCVTRAREALAKLAGFEGADFDLPGGTAVVRGEVEPAEIERALAALGYRAAPLS